MTDSVHPSVHREEAACFNPPLDLTRRYGCVEKLCARDQTVLAGCDLCDFSFDDPALTTHTVVKSGSSKNSPPVGSDL